MNWDDLRYVLEVARAGSVTGAAKKLRVAHTTVYRRIQALERQHGVALFDRRGTNYSATLAAQTLIQLADDVDKRVNSLERQLTEHDAREQGEVRITTVAALAERLGPALSALSGRYPELCVTVRVGNDMMRLNQGEADIAIRITKAPGDSLVGKRVAEVRFGIFGATPDSRLGADPFDQAWVCLDESMAQTPQARWEATNVPIERVTFRTNARPLFVDMVRRGVGVGVLPWGIGMSDAALTALGEPIEALELPVWLLTHEELRHTPRIRAVMDFLGETLSSSRDQF